jgi:hypothetical protein
MINGKIGERLCGDGPDLNIILRQDAYLIKLRRNVMKFFNVNFEAALVYIQRFEFIRQFLAEDEEKTQESINNEMGTDIFFVKEDFFGYCLTKGQLLQISCPVLFCTVRALYMLRNFKFFFVPYLKI